MGLETYRWVARAVGGAAALGLSHPPVASAYCRTSSCRDCPRDEQTGCVVGGQPVAWPNACVSYSLSERASEMVDLETATMLAAEAFRVWETAACPPHGKPPSIHVEDSFGPAICETVEYNPGRANANLIVFRDDTWPHAGGQDELGLTTVTVNEKGEIVDADIELNSTLPLSVAGVDGKAFVPNAQDLLSLMIHETGHFLGLDHATDPASVMVPSLEPGVVRMALSGDDVAGICAIYPPERDAGECDDSPRGGFASECGADLPRAGAEGCAVRRGRRGPDSEFGAVALGGTLLAMVGRRRRRFHGC